MKSEQQQAAMDLEFRQAGVNPRDVFPLLGRRVWLPSAYALIGGGLKIGRSDDVVDAVDNMGARTVLDIGNADLIIIPADMEHRYTARVRTHASRMGIGILFESHVDALTEANSGRAYADLALAL